MATKIRIATGGSQRVLTQNLRLKPCPELLRTEAVNLWFQQQLKDRGLGHSAERGEILFGHVIRSTVNDLRPKAVKIGHLLSDGGSRGQSLSEEMSQTQPQTIRQVAGVTIGE